MTPNHSSTRHRGRPLPGVKAQSSKEYPSHRAYHAASRIRQLSGMWPNELCKGFVPDMLGIRLIEGLSATVDNDQSDDEMVYSDATEAESEPVDEIVALGLPDDQMEVDTDEEEDENEEEVEEQVEDPGQVQEGDDEEQEEQDEEEKEAEEEEEVEEVEELEDENDLDWAAPKRQSPKKQTPPREKRPSPAKEIIDIEDDESDDETVVDPVGDGFMPNDSPEPVQQNGQSRSDHGVSTPNSASSASSRPRRSIQQPSRLISDTPGSSVRQSTGPAEYTSAALAARSPPGSQPQKPSSQVPVPKPVTSQGNKRLAESSPTASYTRNTPTSASRSGAKRQRPSNARPHHQSQVSRAINWDAVLPTGDEFKESLKTASDALKPILHKFEDLLADINNEQCKLSAVQNSLFQKKNDYANDQKKAQDALEDVERSIANENTTLRGLEEVYRQNPGDAELRTFINKRKQTILEHKEVYVIVKSQLDKSIAGICKTDHEIALVTKRLGQLDAERADVLKEKEGVDKAAKRVTMMSKFMEPSWQATLNMLLQSVGPEALEKALSSGGVFPDGNTLFVL